MNIYLVGFMGSGKSSVGRKLAGRLKREFIDLDELIESGEGNAITGIFQKHGEGYFRILEAKYLRDTGNQQDMIIACGGGTPCFSDNMDYMKRNGFTIYLRMTPTALRSRLAASSGSRPLIANMSDDELLEFIKNQLEERRAWYDQSDLITDGLNVDINRLVSEIPHR